MTDTNRSARPSPRHRPPLPAGDGLAALGDASRRAILACLAEQPRAVGQLAEILPISRPAVSQHLKVLKAGGGHRPRHRHPPGLPAQPGRHRHAA
jgi:hypothetical protein